MSRDTSQIFSGKTIQEFEDEIYKELEGSDFVLDPAESFTVAAKRASLQGERELAQYLYLAQEHKEKYFS